MSTLGLAIMLAGAGPTSPTSIDDDPAGTPPDIATSAQTTRVGADQLPVSPEGPPTEGVPASGTTPAVTTPGSQPLPEPPADNTIIVSSNPRHVPADPLSGINAASFDAVNAVDKAVVAPTAAAYEKAVPKPVRNGLRNVLINLAEPIVFLNFLLQLKPGKAMETLARFGINSTVGVAGLFDMAKRKPFRLPYRDNGFANTLGYYGVGNGPFLFVPVVGPTTARDLVGRVLDLSVLPTLVGRPFNTAAYGIGTGVLKAMNDRVAFDEQITANRAKADPYVATRSFYLKRRQAEIDALHSPAYRARKGIPDPVAPVPEPHVDPNAAPGTEAARPTVSLPSATGLVPAAPAPDPVQP